MVRDILFIPFSNPSDIYIQHSITAVSGETEGGRHYLITNSRKTVQLLCVTCS